MFTKNELMEDIKTIGITKGDIVIVHSSFKSLGELEYGAKTVVDAIFEVIGEDGTLVFPTLCQNDWKNVYRNWHLDAPSDVGYLTNYFRKLPGALRSNQATHSVAAIGRDAAYITKTHGETGLIPGPFGDTPFAKDSPWEKLYELNAKILLIGVGSMYITLRHLAEYRVIDKNLQKAKMTERYEEFKNELFLYENWEKRGINAMLDPGATAEKTSHLAKKGKVGDADCLLYSAEEFVDCCQDAIESRIEGWRNKDSFERFCDWEDRIMAELNGI